MINPNDSLQYRNVVSQPFTTHYSNFGEVIINFFTTVEEAGVTLKGAHFYSLENIPKNEIMIGQLFVSIEEDYAELPGDMKFHSYFSIEDMVSIHVIDHFEEYTEVAYALLLNYIDKNPIQQVTPIFHILNGDKDFPFITVKIGTAEVSNESIWK